jgi:hypothetical protein
MQFAIRRSPRLVICMHREVHVGKVSGDQSAPLVVALNSQDWFVVQPQNEFEGHLYPMNSLLWGSVRGGKLR